MVMQGSGSIITGGREKRWKYEKRTLKVFDTLMSPALALLSSVPILPGGTANVNASTRNHVSAGSVSVLGDRAVCARANSVALRGAEYGNEASGLHDKIFVGLHSSSGNVGNEGRDSATNLCCGDLEFASNTRGDSVFTLAQAFLLYGKPTINDCFSGAVQTVGEATCCFWGDSTSAMTLSVDERVSADKSARSGKRTITPELRAAGLGCRRIVPTGVGEDAVVCVKDMKVELEERKRNGTDDVIFTRLCHK